MKQSILFNWRREFIRQELLNNNKDGGWKNNHNMLQTCDIDKREISDIPQAMSAHSVHLEYSYVASEVSAFGI